MTISHKNLCVSIFFIIFIALGIHIYSDFGLSWDEPGARERGLISLKYVLEQLNLKMFSLDPELARISTNLSDFSDRDYGVAFDLPMAILERALALDTAAAQFRLRHFFTFLAFVLGVFALYRIAERRFSSWQVGLLASLFLILSPRIFAESFYNSKDIVFMAFFTIGLNTAIIFLRSPNIKTALIHGLVTAITTDVRVMGIVLLVITAGMVLVRFLRRESQLTNSVYALATYFLVTLFIVVALWPWLWVDPFSHIAAAVKSMARYRWYENNLYLGHYVRATNIPWHYILVWIGVTTPFIYLCFGSLGICTVVTKIIKKRLLWSEDQEMQDLLFLGVFVGAIIAVIALKSVLYDGWRQLYFIYPAFIVLAIRGLLIIYQSISRSKIARLLLILFVAVGLCQQAVWIYRNHPLQNVYFNFLNDERKPTQFDMDYWGLSNKEAFRHILSADEREVISVKAVSDNPLFNGLIFLPDKDRKRIVDAVSEDQADYLVNNYRFLNGKPYVPDTAKFAVVYEIHTGGRVILSVLKRVTQ